MLAKQARRLGDNLYKYIVIRLTADFIIIIIFPVIPYKFSLFLPQGRSVSELHGHLYNAI